MTHPLTGQRSRREQIAELYDSHAAGLFVYCADQLGDLGSTADVLASVLTSAPEDPPRAALYAYARREIHRRDVVYTPPVVDPLVDPASALVERILRELRPQQREVLVLGHVCGLDLAELAWVLDVAPDTAEELTLSAAHRFRQILNMALAATGPGVSKPVADVYGALAVAPLRDVLGRLPWPEPPAALRIHLAGSSTADPAPLFVKPRWPVPTAWPQPLGDADPATTTGLFPRDLLTPPAPSRVPDHDATTTPMPKLRDVPEGPAREWWRGLTPVSDGASAPRPTAPGGSGLPSGDDALPTRSGGTAAPHATGPGGFGPPATSADSVALPTRSGGTAAPHATGPGGFGPPAASADSAALPTRSGGSGAQSRWAALRDGAAALSPFEAFRPRRPAQDGPGRTTPRGAKRGTGEPPLAAPTGQAYFMPTAPDTDSPADAPGVAGLSHRPASPGSGGAPSDTAPAASSFGGAPTKATPATPGSGGAPSKAAPAVPGFGATPSSAAPAGPDRSPAAFGFMAIPPATGDFMVQQGLPREAAPLFTPRTQQREPVYLMPPAPAAQEPEERHPADAGPRPASGTTALRTGSAAGSEVTKTHTADSRTSHTRTTDPETAEPLRAGIWTPDTATPPAGDDETTWPRTRAADAGTTTARPRPGTKKTAGSRATGATKAAGGRPKSRPKPSKARKKKRRSRHHDWAWELIGFLICVAIAMIVFFSMPMIIKP